MMSAAPASTFDDLRQLVSEELGLHFPAARKSDLQRGLKSAARELGLANLDELARWIGSVSHQTRSALLARHLTVGETYFFRHSSLFEALEQKILPELIRAKASAGRRLHLWSAACCTGEEAYSLAIAVYRALPDLNRWDVSITGTDLNTRFLQRAEKGVFSTWSFRDTPPGFRERYFSHIVRDKWEIRPEIRRLVKFAPANLANDLAPHSPLRGADIIFCRNALIYFTPEQATRVIHRLADALPDGGWLITSPSETAMVSLPTLAPVQFPGAMAFRKTSHPAKSRPAPLRAFNDVDFPAPPPLDRAPVFEPTPAPPPLAVVPDLAATAPATEEPAPASAAERAAELALAIRTCANDRRLPDALAHCDELVALNKCDASAHYLRASILAETGDRTSAIEALKRVLYLEPDFVLAHFALGHLHRVEGDSNRATRDFAHALELARRQPPDQLLPASDGLTAGQLTQILTTMSAHPVG
jgi:Methylase of chemotaxis methyl-accepting proteins